MIRLRAYEHGVLTGNVILDGAYLADRSGRPCSREITVDRALVLCKVPAEDRYSLHLQYEIPGFARVKMGTRLLASRAEPYNLNYEIARARMLAVERARSEWKSAMKFEPSQEVMREIDTGRWLMRAASREHLMPPDAALFADKSLIHSTWSGERMAIEAGNFGLERRLKSRHRPLRLCCRMPRNARSKRVQRAFVSVFDAVRIPFDWHLCEPHRGRTRFAAVTRAVRWAKSRELRVAGRGLVWLRETTLPRWIRGRPFEEMAEASVERVSNLASHFRRQVDVWDVTDELQAGGIGITGKNIFPECTTDDLVELAHRACVAVGKADKKAIRVISCDDPFGEVCADGPPRTSALDFFKRLLDAHVPFDALGLKFNVGAENDHCRDLFQLSRLLDEFCRLNKPIFITEVAVPSGVHTDETASPRKRDFSSSGYWHRPWDEPTQAEYVDGFLRIAAGKHLVNEISWCDLSDRGHHYYPHGGLLRADYSPKPAFNHLLALTLRLRDKE